MRSQFFLIFLGFFLLFPASVWAYGEGEDISYHSRAIHLLTNEARLDPHYVLGGCGDNCSEGLDCYEKVIDPVYWDHDLHRAAKFHANMLATLNRCIQHASPCELVPTAGVDFPDKCDGNPSCACKARKAVCGTVGTDTFDRIRMFSDIASAENIASKYGTPMDTFKLWIFEKGEGTGCTTARGIGHRVNILAPRNKSQGIGTNFWVVQDFGHRAKEQHAIAAASHYRDGTEALHFMGLYKAVSGAVDGTVNIAGTCHDLELIRGTDMHGLWSLTYDDAPAECTPYVFEISDKNGQIVRYPSTGSLLYSEHKGEVCLKSWQAEGLESCYEGGTNPVVPNPTDPSDPDPSDPNPIDPSDPDPSDPNPTDPSDPDPSDPNPTDPSDPDPSDTGKPLPDEGHASNDGADDTACSASLFLGDKSGQVPYGLGLILFILGLVLVFRGRKEFSS